MSDPRVYRRQMPENGAVNENAQILFLPVDAICPNRAQPRNHFDTNTMIRLADSVRRYGILQPLTVRYIDKTGSEARGETPRYELIAGERRLRAAKLAGLIQVPCIIARADDSLSAELAMIENLLREDLDMFEQARAFGRLIVRFSLTQEQVARKMSMSQSAVANKLRLLKFSIDEQKQILSGGLTERHARALLRLPADADRPCLIQKVIDEKMNVASCESFVDTVLHKPIRYSQSADESKMAEKMIDWGGRKKLVLKDLRVFYNSIEHAVNILKQTGLNPQIEQKEEHGRVVICIALDNPTATREMVCEESSEKTECFT